MNGADDFDRRMRLKALEKKVAEDRAKRQASEFARRAGPDYSQNLAKGSLDKDTLVAKGGSYGKDVTPEKLSVGKTDDLSPDMTKQKIVSGDEFMEKQRAAKKASLMNRYKKAVELGDKSLMQRLQDEAKDFARSARKAADKAGDIAKKGAKGVPLLGTAIALATGLSSGEASAAMPFLDAAEAAGPAPGSLEYKMESGEELSPEEQMQLARMRQQPTEEQLKSAKEKRRMQALAKLVKSREL